MSLVLARTLVFSTSAAVLVVEILAVRLLAPYLGISLVVFTGVIGVILAGISLGAWLGGRAADRRDPRSMLGPALITGGITVMLSPLLVDLVGPSLSNDPVSIVVAATVGFLVPAVALSAIPPMVVKIRLSSLDQTGTVVGSFSAVGTAGAIFGTFVTGFVLIAAFPTRPILAAVGIALVGTGLVMWPRRSVGGAVGSLALVGALAGVLLTIPGPCQVETPYHCAIVAEDPARPSGRILILDRLHNSYVDLDDPTHLEFRYTQLIADIVDTHIPEGPLDVVSIGGGAMTLPTYFDVTRPDSTNLVLEIDGIVVDLARDQLGVGASIRVAVDDARISLRQVADDAAQVVIGDAYSGAAVPWHLTTVEYAAEIGRVLDDRGVYVVNVIDFNNLRFAKATAHTLLGVFDHVVLFAPPHYLSGSSGGNFVFAASRSPIDATATIDVIAARGGVETAWAGDELASFADGAILLRDDFAPVDQILGS